MRAFRAFYLLLIRVAKIVLTRERGGEKESDKSKGTTHGKGYASQAFQRATNHLSLAASSAEQSG